MLISIICVSSLVYLSLGPFLDRALLDLLTILRQWLLLMPFFAIRASFALASISTRHTELEAFTVAFETTRSLASAAFPMLQAFSPYKLSHLGVKGQWISLQDFFFCQLYHFIIFIIVATVLAATLRAATLTISKAFAVKLQASRLGAGAFFSNCFFFLLDRHSQWSLLFFFCLSLLLLFNINYLSLGFRFQYSLWEDLYTTIFVHFRLLRTARFVKVSFTVRNILQELCFEGRGCLRKGFRSSMNCKSEFCGWRNVLERLGATSIYII